MGRRIFSTVKALNNLYFPVYEKESGQGSGTKRFHQCRNFNAKMFHENSKITLHHEKWHTKAKHAKAINNCITQSRRTPRDIQEHSWIFTYIHRIIRNDRGVLPGYHRPTFSEWLGTPRTIICRFVSGTQYQNPNKPIVELDAVLLVRVLGLWWRNPSIEWCHCQHERQ